MRTIKNILGWIIPLVLGLLLAFLFKQYVVQLVHVDGTSMQPNLQNNEWVLAIPMESPKHGSVIVFNADGVDPQVTEKKVYVKRVIGLPGDTVQADNGHLLVNGHLVNQKYISTSQSRQGTGNWNFKSLAQQYQWPNHSNAITVPPHEYFVLGDHRSVSNDSRYYGFVPASKIYGVVKVPYGIHNQTSRYNVNREWQHFLANQN